MLHRCRILPGSGWSPLGDQPYLRCPLRYGEKDTQASLLDLGARMLAVLCDRVKPGTEVVAVEAPFAVPLIDSAPRVAFPEPPAPAHAAATPGSFGGWMRRV